MTPEKLLQEASTAGVEISVDPPDKLKIVGDQGIIEQWLPEIRRNKSAILEKLAPFPQHSNGLAACEGCSRLKKIDIQGKIITGCLYLAQGQYSDGWRRLPDTLKYCIWN